MSKKSTIKKEKNNGFVNFYKNNYKKLLIIPIIMFLLALFVIYQTIKIDGTPIHRDISLKGGLSSIVEIDTQLSDEELKLNLEDNFKSNSFTVSQLYEGSKKIGFIIDTDLKEDELILFLENTLDIKIVDGENYSSNFISPTLSNLFFKQVIFKGLIPAFILMTIVVFIYFREFVPSIAIILSAIFDIIVTIGILNFFGVKISIAGIGAFLMLIGYSIDTDVLLTNRLIKERGDNYFEKTFFAFKTGILMTATTLFAGIGALILTNSSVIYEIALILVIGLLVDFISTWVQNAGILLWWLEKKNN